MKITKYPDVLALQYCPLFNTHFAIDFSERAIQGNIDWSILLTARMGRYGVKVALLRCLIRLIIFNIAPARIISIGVHVKKGVQYFFDIHLSSEMRDGPAKILLPLKPSI